MKKAFLFLSILLLPGLVISQSHFTQAVKEEGKLLTKKPLPKPTATVLWSSDFSDAADWVFGNNSVPEADWVIGVFGPAGLASSFMGGISSSELNNKFALFDSDALGDNSSVHDAWVEMANSVDLSANANVAIEFESYYRKYQDNVVLEVSNNGTNWDPYPVHTTLQINESSDNPEKIWVDITATAGNQVTVWIRFRFTGNWDYAWMVDNVSIIEIPDNDLLLNQHYFLHNSNEIDSTKTAYYTHIPKQQAQFDTLAFAAITQNRGVQSQTGSKITTDVYGPVNYLDTSASATILSGDVDTLFVQNEPFVPFNKGEYEVTFSVASDFADDEPSNNITSFEFEVGDTVYARDNNKATNGVWFGPNIKWQCGNLFEILAIDTVTSLSFWFENSTTEGAEITAHVYDAGFSNIVSSTTITLADSQIGKWITIPVAETQLLPGNYFAAFEQVNSNESVLIATGKNNPEAPPLTSFTDEDADNTWQYMDFIPFIRMNLKEKICPQISATLNITDPTCGNSDGSITAIPSGGSAPYIYQWGTNSGGQTAQTATGLAEGVYTVFISDDNNCILVDTILLANPAAPTITGTQTDVLCGGICTGAINITVNGGTTPYSFLWNNTETTEDLSNICGGGYHVTVTDAANCSNFSIFGISEPKTLTLKLSESGDTGFGDGLASVEVSGGTEPYEYLWHTGDTTAVLNGLSGGYYSVTVTDDNGCTAVDSVYVTGINNTISQSFSVSLFPNPSSGLVTIMTDGANSNGFNVEVFTLNGKWVEAISTTDSIVQFSVADYRAGIYMVKIQQNGNPTFKKLIVVE